MKEWLGSVYLLGFPYVPCLLRACSFSCAAFFPSRIAERKNSFINKNFHLYYLFDAFYLTLGENGSIEWRRKGIVQVLGVQWMRDSWVRDDSQWLTTTAGGWWWQAKWHLGSHADGVNKQLMAVTWLIKRPLEREINGIALKIFPFSTQASHSFKV